MNIQKNAIWALLFSLVSSWVFWPRSLIRDGEFLGIITDAKGSVRLRPAGSFNWIPARSGTQLHPFDSISTGANSTAAFELLDKTLIKMPEDTQLKIQSTILAQGISITLAQGGIAVDASKPSLAANARAQGASPSQSALTAKVPLMVKAAEYSIDLSNLAGTLELMPNTPLVVSKPEEVRVESPRGNVSLAQLATAGGILSGIGNQAAALEIPLQNSASIAFAEEPPPKPVVPPKLPVIPIVDIQPNFPIISKNLPSYAINQPISRQLKQSFLIEARDDRSPDDPWQAALRIGVRDSVRTTFIKRPIFEKGFQVSLSELGEIINERELESLDLTVEAAVIREKSGKSEIRLSGIKVPLSLLSLTRNTPLSVELDRLSYIESESEWIQSSKTDLYEIKIQLWEPKLIANLLGFLVGSESFRIQPLNPLNTSLVHFIKEARIVASIPANDAVLISELHEKIGSELVFKGQSSAFLGGKSKFDLSEAFAKHENVYYARKNKVIRLDRNLLETQQVARDFLKKLDPYYFRESVEILKSF